MARILVVEDELPLVRLMGWLLTEAGHVVAAATSHESVAERMDVALPDILVCNSGMDSDEKRQKFAEWREARPGLRILDIRCSSYPAVPYTAVGADSHLAMPFHADDLVDAVEALDGGGSRPAPPR